MNKSELIPVISNNVSCQFATSSHKIIVKFVIFSALVKWGERVDVIHLNVKLENLFCGKIVTQLVALLKMKYLKDFLGV